MIKMPVIEITISQGRSVEQKRELIKVLTRGLRELCKHKRKR